MFALRVHRGARAVPPLPPNLAQQLATLRQPLLRFAQLQLRNDALAEDAVSETMLAVLEAPERFEGRSSLRTYATGILKFKIVDVLRRRGREVEVMPQEDQTHDEALEALFNADGHYVDRPPAWHQPDAALEQAQFMAVMQQCIERLPPRLARVFMLREWQEHDTDEICTELGITANNAGVMLFRARMQLRECLQARWFKGPPQ
ncbi:MAG: sigma-70 family RNA polymerase sigma factor [Rubrivivax sp.]|nr:sigma-70 family RNA polymerase sigma factor [Rubrivivax sp.]